MRVAIRNLDREGELREVSVILWVDRVAIVVAANLHE